MWGYQWVPMKTNPTKSPVTLHKNAKVANIFPCVAVEDLHISQGVNRPQLVWKKSGDLRMSTDFWWLIDPSIYVLLLIWGRDAGVVA